MKNMLALLKAGLRQNFGLSVIRHRLFRQKKDLWFIPLVFFALIGLTVLIYLYMDFLAYLFRTLQAMRQEKALLTLTILTGQFFILVFGLFYVLSAFYFSRDLEFLVSLPARPFAVLGAKFGVIMVNEYLTVILLLAPAFAVYGGMSGKGLFYWLSAGLVFLLLPVIPLALAGILVMVMMRLVNVSRKKDFFILAGSLVLLGLVLFLQLGLSSGRNPEEMMTLLTSSDGLMRVIGEKFPPCIWAADLLAEGFSSAGLRALLLFCAVSAAVLLLMLLAAEKLFYRGLIGISETSGRRRKAGAADPQTLFAGRLSPLLSILAREWKIMNRTPIFLLNGILSVVLIPLVLFLMLRGETASGSIAILKMLGSGDRSAEIVFCAVFFIICGSMNGTASSAFSREGRNFWISKVIPVNPGLQVRAKFLHSYLVSLLGTFGGSLVALIVLKLSWQSVLPAALLALAGGVLLTALNMAVDLARPLLQWTSPQRAIKQNLNVVMAMVLDFLILYAFFQLYKLLRGLGVDGNQLTLLLLLILLGSALLAVSTLEKTAVRRYLSISA